MARARALVLALSLAACAKSQAPGIESHVALRSVSGCPAVERAIQDAAVHQMRQDMESSLRWAGQPGIAQAGGAVPEASGSAPAAYTTTNVQVAGVDEPDLIKTDGARIYALAGHRLHLARSWPPASLAATASADVEGWPSGLFLASGRVAVISAVPDNKPTVCAALCPIGAPCPACSGSSTAKVTLFDPATLSVQEELWLPGSAAHARRIGDEMYLVTSDPPRWPKGLRWWPGNLSWSDPAFPTAVRALEDANESAIRATPLPSWLPPVQRRLAGGETVSIPYDCSQFSLGNAPVRLGFATVTTLDLAHPDKAPSRATVLGQVDLAYASESALYLLTRHWWWQVEAGNRQWTYVHKFDLTRPGGAHYLASGGFAGFPIDSYSLDEHRGYLRAATSSFDVVTASATGTRFTQSSALRVLDAKLNLAASLELAQGESVRGSRFLGDRAFVVTFHGIDPLDAIDLSDPAHPRLAGKLEVPGFSTYLHPIDDTHLLAVGVDLPQTGGWQGRSVQLSVFDVSDLSNPRRTAQQKIGTAYGYTESLWDPHAFNWFPAKNLLAIPFSDWSPVAGGDSYWGTFASDLRVFEVHEDSIAPRGALSLKDLYVTWGDAKWSSSWSPFIRRSVMAADAGGSSFVYAFSDAGLRVAPLDALAAPLATVSFAH